MDLTGLTSSVVVLPAFFTLVSTLFAAWLNSKGVWRKQQSDEARELRDEQKSMREELRQEVGALRVRLDASEAKRLDQAEELIKALGTVSTLELELTTLRGLVGTLQQKVGDRRRDPITGEQPGVAPPVVLAVEVKPQTPETGTDG